MGVMIIPLYHHYLMTLLMLSLKAYVTVHMHWALQNLKQLLK